MKENLFEMHVHTSEVSTCAILSAEEVIKKYSESGYKGLVLTDHMNERTFRNMSNPQWHDMVEHYLSGYRKMKSILIPDFTVLLGMEITFKENFNDYLIYGLDEDFLFNNGNLMDLGIREFRKLADKNNLLVFQAHPFRVDMTVTDPYLLDGIEIYNGNSSHNSSNDIANIWADKFGLRKISGSDFHYFWGMAPGGLIFEDTIKDNKDLTEALRNNRFRIKNKNHL